MTIRLGTADDTERIVEMGLRFVAATQYRQFLRTTRESLTALVGTVLDNGVILLAENDEQLVVGMFAMVIIDGAFDGVRYADEVAFWVEPEARGAGSAGPKLLEMAKGTARNLGAQTLKVAAPVDAAGVARFFLRQGFLPVETTFTLPLVALGD